MDRMHADVVRQLRKRKALGEARVQKISGLLEPPRRHIGACLRVIGVTAGGFSDHFEHQPFDNEWGDSVQQVEFLVESPGQHFVSSPMKFGGVVHPGRAFARAFHSGAISMMKDRPPESWKCSACVSFAGWKSSADVLHSRVFLPYVSV
jgi:hypothetical protein